MGGSFTRALELARPGRPASVFERRSSRLARVLLQHPGRKWSVRACAKESGLNEGHVSRIVARLVADEFLRKEDKRLRVADPQCLLDAWREAADFSKHRVLRGHVAARSGEELLGLVSRRLADAHLTHAATGLGAAWLYDHFAMFRLATIFLREWPRPDQRGPPMPRSPRMVPLVTLPGTLAHEDGPLTCAHRGLGSRRWPDRLGAWAPAPPSHLKACSHRPAQL